jgi:hypothetical protein
MESKPTRQYSLELYFVSYLNAKDGETKLKRLNDLDLIFDDDDDEEEEGGGGRRGGGGREEEEYKPNFE